MTKVKEKQSLYDIVTENFGQIDNLVKLSNDNGISISEDLTTGQDLLINNSGLGEEDIKKKISEQKLTFNNIFVSSKILGLLNFDNVNDTVVMNSVPDVQGNRTLTFKLFLKTDSFPAFGSHESVLSFQSVNSDHLAMTLEDNFLGLQVANIGNSKKLDITGLDNKILDIFVKKGTSSIVIFTINGSGSPVTKTGIQINVGDKHIGSRSGEVNFLGNALVWDFEFINDDTTSLISKWVGQPNGNQNSAWVDSVSGNNGTVLGSPTTIDIQL